jgi:hypothetical protein
VIGSLGCVPPVKEVKHVTIEILEQPLEPASTIVKGT